MAGLIAALICIIVVLGLLWAVKALWGKVFG